ncbi:hypothetical protein FA09DRAFT_340479 [Tilletiopsis washingtonensis]|uniref:Protein ARV n=1 Tax=Tilletiopsis washingtonensis TaxID=58919 RepID=A0A316Z3G2_9BASI|nr:hypothetical protein FA09DRAFT_340479 [Tilletiopsis washingtonensis]PWN96290.1 hypothetical protein FA09DRAFT_340479 [Tilletiopsis washingtonensis]
MTPRAAEALPQAPLCIHCGARVASLWRSYGAPAATSGAAASAASGSGAGAERRARAAETPLGPVALPPQGAHVVLTPCAACEKGHAGADAYVEGEWGGVGLDLLLVRPSAYRHLLFNRPWLAGAGVSHATLLRHGLALGLVDAFLQWRAQPAPLPALLASFGEHAAARLLALALRHGALHVLVGLLLRRICKSASHRRQALRQAHAALQLASLAPLSLLVLLYLWRPRDAAPGTPPSLGELSTRTLLGGLSAGVGLGVVIPRRAPYTTWRT